MKHFLSFVFLTSATFASSTLSETICPLKLSNDQLEYLKSGKTVVMGSVELHTTGPRLAQLLQDNTDERLQAGFISKQIINSKPETEECKYKVGLEKSLVSIIAVRTDTNSTPPALEKTQIPTEVKTGTFIFQRNNKKEIKLYKFSKVVAGQKGKLYEDTALKKILFVQGADGTLYLWTDPRENSQQATFDMMEKAHVSFTDDLEGMDVQFKPLGKKIRLKEDNKEYEVVEVTDVGPPKPPPRDLKRKVDTNLQSNKRGRS